MTVMVNKVVFFITPPAPQYSPAQITAIKKVPQENSNSLNCKKPREANNSRSYRFAAIKKNFMSADEIV